MRDCGREKVVGLVARTLGGREAERPDEFGQEVELLDQFVVEDSSALVAGEELVLYVGTNSVSQPTSAARGASACQRRMRKLEKPTSALLGLPSARRIDLGSAWYAR